MISVDRRSRDPDTPRTFISDKKNEKGQDLPDPKEVIWQGKITQMYTQYDLLCYALSILGRAPRGAKRKTHHYPLLLLCTKFLTLAAAVQGKKEPFLANITFVDEEVVEEAFSLPNGLPKRDESRWRSRMRRCADTTRYWVLAKTTTRETDNVLLGSTLPPPRGTGAQICGFRAAMLREAGFVFANEEDHRDGNCAETYALLMLRL